MRACPSCGRENSADAKSCAVCGAKLFGTGVLGSSGGAETSGMAIASLVCGLFFLVFPAPILAVIFGHISRSAIRRSAGRLKGSGMALTGLMLGYVGVCILPILILAIAIPNLVRSRAILDEDSAADSLRALNTAAKTYASTYGTFPPNLAAMSPPAKGGAASASSAELIDRALTSGKKLGYVFRYEAFSTDGGARLDAYRITADPVTPGTSGERHFYTDQSGVIRVGKTTVASKHSPPIF